MEAPNQQNMKEAPKVPATYVQTLERDVPSPVTPVKKTKSLPTTGPLIITPEVSEAIDTARVSSLPLSVEQRRLHTTQETQEEAKILVVESEESKRAQDIVLTQKMMAQERKNFGFLKGTLLYEFYKEAIQEAARDDVVRLRQHGEGMLLTQLTGDELSILARRSSAEIYRDRQDLQKQLAKANERVSQAQAQYGHNAWEVKAFEQEARKLESQMEDLAGRDEKEYRQAKDRLATKAKELRQKQLTEAVESGKYTTVEDIASGVNPIHEGLRLQISTKAVDAMRTGASPDQVREMILASVGNVTREDSVDKAVLEHRGIDPESIPETAAHMASTIVELQQEHAQNVQEQQETHATVLLETQEQNSRYATQVEARYAAAELILEVETTQADAAIARVGRTRTKLQKARALFSRYGGTAAAGGVVITVATGGAATPFVAWGLVGLTLARGAGRAKEAYEEAGDKLAEARLRKRENRQTTLTRGQAITKGLREAIQQMNEGETIKERAIGEAKLLFASTIGLVYRTVYGTERRAASLDTRIRSILSPEVFEKGYTAVGTSKKRYHGDREYCQPEFVKKDGQEGKIIFKGERQSALVILQEGQQAETLEQLQNVMVLKAEAEWRLQYSLFALSIDNPGDQERMIINTLTQADQIIQNWLQNHETQHREYERTKREIDRAMEQVLLKDRQGDQARENRYKAGKAAGAFIQTAIGVTPVIGAVLKIGQLAGHHDILDSLTASGQELWNRTAFGRAVKLDIQDIQNGQHMPEIAPAHAAEITQHHETGTISYGHDAKGDYAIVDGKKEYITYLSSRVNLGNNVDSGTISSLPSNSSNIELSKMGMDNTGHEMYRIDQMTVGRTASARSWFAKWDGHEYVFYRTDDTAFLHPVRHWPNTSGPGQNVTATETQMQGITTNQQLLQELDKNITLSHADQQFFVPGLDTVININKLPPGVTGIHFGNYNPNTGQVPVTIDYHGQHITGTLEKAPSGDVILRDNKGNLIDTSPLNTASSGVPVDAPVQVDQFANSLVSHAHVAIDQAKQFVAGERNHYINFRSDGMQISIRSYMGGTWDPHSNNLTDIHNYLHGLPSSDTSNNLLFQLDTPNGHIYIPDDGHGTINFNSDVTIYTEHGQETISGHQAQLLCRTYGIQLARGTVNNGVVSKVFTLTGPEQWTPNAAANAVDVHTVDGTSGIQTLIQHAEASNGSKTGVVMIDGRTLDITDDSGNISADTFKIAVDPKHSDFGPGIQDTKTGDIFAYNPHYEHITNAGPDFPDGNYLVVTDHNGVAHAISEGNNDPLTAKLADLQQTDSVFNNNHVEILLNGNPTSSYSLIEHNGKLVLTDNQGNVIAKGSVQRVTSDAGIAGSYTSTTITLQGVPGHEGNVNISLQNGQPVQIDVNQFQNSKGLDWGAIENDIIQNAPLISEWTGAGISALGAGARMFRSKRERIVGALAKTGGGLVEIEGQLASSLIGNPIAWTPLAITAAAILIDPITRNAIEWTFKRKKTTPPVNNGGVGARTRARQNQNQKQTPAPKVPRIPITPNVLPTPVILQTPDQNDDAYILTPQLQAIDLGASPVPEPQQTQTAQFNLGGSPIIDDHEEDEQVWGGLPVGARTGRFDASLGRSTTGPFPYDDIDDEELEQR